MKLKRKEEKLGPQSFWRLWIYVCSSLKSTYNNCFNRHRQTNVCDITFIENNYPLLLLLGCLVPVQIGYLSRKNSYQDPISDDVLKSKLYYPFYNLRHTHKWHGNCKFRNFDWPLLKRPVQTICIEYTHTHTHSTGWHTPAIFKVFSFAFCFENNGWQERQP